MLKSFEGTLTSLKYVQKFQTDSFEYHVHLFLFIRKWFIRKWGYKGQKDKKVEGFNTPNVRKFPNTSFEKSRFKQLENPFLSTKFR